MPFGAFLLMSLAFYPAGRRRYSRINRGGNRRSQGVALGWYTRVATERPNASGVGRQVCDSAVHCRAELFYESGDAGGEVGGGKVGFDDFFEGATDDKAVGTGCESPCVFSC